MSNKETLILAYPIELGDKTTITEIQLDKRIKGKHLRSITDASTELEQGLGLMSSLSGLDPDIIDEMDEEDIQAALAIIKKNREKTPAP